MGPLTDPWGIEDRFHDAFGRERLTGDETRREILAAMGVDPNEAAEAIRAHGRGAAGARADAAGADAGHGDGHPGGVGAAGGPPAFDVRVVKPGDHLRLPTGSPNGELRLEDGTTVAVGADGALPRDLPFGYHTFTPAGAPASAAPIPVLASPGACFLPADLRIWGWAVQLYAARSRQSWGIGDLADLRELGAWTRDLGGGALMVNPLCAPAPVSPIEPSPYYPSTRRFRNPLYLRIEELPGAADGGDEITALGAEGRVLGAERRIDRERIFALKSRALEILWARFGGDAAFDRYRGEQGASLDEFAAYCTLAERHGKDWRRWPAELGHPGNPAVRRLVAEDPRVRYHAWVQWQLDEQLRRASADVRIFHDLPVGFDIAGADGWCWQDTLAADISIGCPPDGFNVDGQDWGLSPFIPSKLRACGYRPFIETIRAMLRHAGGLRIDHVMGLFRLFWIPRRLGNKGGTYVRYPVDELLAIVAIESQRARAVIVGEDLGTILPGTRELLAQSGLLSYRLLYFESETPDKFPEQALSGVTTHDLATIGGIWTGAAADHARSAGVTPHEEGLTFLKNRLQAVTGLGPEASLDEVIVETHRALGKAPSRVLLATLDDALGVLEQPNMPGTTTSWPNWSLALPRTIDEIKAAALPRAIAGALKR